MNMGKKQTRLLCYIQLAKKYILNVAKLIYISFENNIILMLDNSKTLKLSQLDKQWCHLVNKMSAWLIIKPTIIGTKRRCQGKKLCLLLS